MTEKIGHFLFGINFLFYYGLLRKRAPRQLIFYIRPKKSVIFIWNQFLIYCSFLRKRPSDKTKEWLCATLCLSVLPFLYWHAPRASFGPINLLFFLFGVCRF